MFPASLMHAEQNAKKLRPDVGEHIEEDVVEGVEGEGFDFTQIKHGG